MSEQLPAFLCQSLARQYGDDTAALILEGMGGRRCTTLRANLLKTTPGAVAGMLRGQGIDFATAAFSEAAFLLPQATEADLWKLPAYESGEIYLQSLSSMLPPLALQPRAGADILDMAAAPGGKTAQMATLTGNKASITACEINRIRADKLRHNLQKQGASRVNVMLCDARKLEDFFRFDQILLDAPCSGSGTLLSCEPRGLAAFSEKLVRSSAATQLQLLKKALSLLKSRGTLVYSTCSILEIENENVVRAALKGVKAHLVPIDLPGLDTLPLLPSSLPGVLCIRPTAEYEGFFMAKVEKD